jgi:hypothetical protein
MYPPLLNIDAGDAASAGLLPAVSRASSLGYNPNVSIGVTADAWGAVGPYPWLAAATNLRVNAGTNDVNLTGTGAWTVVISGLDASFNTKSQTVALNGATFVTVDVLGQPINFYRINAIRVATAGTARTNLADVNVQDAAGGNTLRGIVLAGDGIAHQAPFTVPVGFTLDVKEVLLAVDAPNGSSGRFARIKTYFAAPAPAAAIQALILGNTDAQPYNHVINPPIAIAEKTDFALSIVLVNNNGTIVTAGWNGILRRNK